MDFEVSDDRRMLADTLSRWLAAEYDIAARNRIAYTAPYHAPDKWAAFAELGALMALAPEEHGGFGGTGFDVVTVFEALGRGLCPEPVLPQLMAIRLLTAAGEDLEPALSGATRYAVAVGELSAPYTLDFIETRAAGGTVTGRKSVVYGAPGADRVLVAAQVDGRLGVVEVDGSAASVTGYGMVDGGPAGEVFLDAAPARTVLADGAAALQDALDWGALALCAEAVGAMDWSFATLLAYLKERKQFGKRIGDFQALQHRAVDVSIEIEQARSITILAASRMGSPEQSRTCSMAKNLIGRAAKLTAEETIQMHGGIAMTWEYALSHYAKRLTMIDAQLGDTDFHLERVMESHMAA
ncbi:acyl-CoA dehydrogenase family protein [Acuticoccus sp. I52.16.1]|uniref:acyl-CoA dehydrogenase family protein n=1 Tax=Acuticoccus sp. I52.16.1 TaxID=2928472 RepID=UPI001FD0111F|nr:acyl-CoA dehydrogenase family protein [Acuticoccus sp. I52.16.1]UOM33034.1 acyl-CoA/acyl-ACP dehydrogenase [Acuticoccus sp. I52.16.1]